MKPSVIFDPKVAYSTIEHKNIMSYIDIIRQGIQYRIFQLFANASPFTLTEWSSFLHVSERTLQRHQKDKRKFDPLQSEKILEIVLLYKKGSELFGNSMKFDSWLDTENVALGGVKPKSLLDSSFGIALVKDELSRIEFGILA